MAVKRKKIKEKPVYDCTLPQNTKPEIAFLTEPEQTALLSVIPNTTHGRAIQFLLGTGMRVSELCGLKWSDFQSDEIHVERVNMTIQDWRDDGYINVETLPKTTRGKRIIPLTKTLITLLNQQSLAQKQECLKTGRKFDDKDGYIFANALGNPANRNNIARAFRSLCKNAGIESRGIHTLRHTFATNWVRHLLSWLFAFERYIHHMSLPSSTPPSRRSRQKLPKTQQVKGKMWRYFGNTRVVRFVPVQR